MDGKADGWKEIKGVIPKATLPIIAARPYRHLRCWPSQPQWTDALVAKTEPLKNPTIATS
jgi:hypothetical protein